MVPILKAPVAFHYQWLSGFPVMMLPEEYLLFKELFSVGVLWAVQPSIGWGVSADGVAALDSAAAWFSPDSLSIKIQELI